VADLIRHTHADQQRRRRGACPACDLLWAWQDERVGDRRVEERMVQQAREQRRRLWELGRARYGKAR